MQNKDKTENFRHHDEEEHTSQITESTHPSLNPPKPAATSLNLNSSAKTAIKDINAFTQKQVMKENSIKSNFTALGLDLNEPLHPYNELGRASSPSPSASECGSTTGQAEISESMKKWIEMKQNGFVSIVKVKRPPLPRPKRQQSIKNKELNERIRVHHPAQLLSGLFSRDLQPRQEIEPSLAPSFLTRCSQKEVFNVHLARWKAVFTQTEVSLSEEENQLETWLKQVEELNSQCQEGLKFVSTNGFLHLDAAKELRILKSPEAYERELAVRAAAASIYSTCDMTMNAKNVPYFKNKNRQI